MKICMGVTSAISTVVGVPWSLFMVAWYFMLSFHYGDFCLFPMAISLVCAAVGPLMLVNLCCRSVRFAGFVVGWITGVLILFCIYFFLIAFFVTVRVPRSEYYPFSVFYPGMIIMYLLKKKIIKSCFFIKISLNFQFFLCHSKFKKPF